jgi:glutamate dehydrogenase (NAD(P)+)
VMNALSEDAQDRRHVTGLSPSHGGLGIDANGYTAFGLNAAMLAAVDELGIHLGRAVVQGTGAVGLHMLRYLDAASVKIAGVSNATGALLAKPDSSLPAGELIEVLQAEGDAGIRTLGERWTDAIFTSDRNAIFSVEADLFVPAALTRTLDLERNLPAAREENSEAFAIERWYEQARPKLILQGANHPLSIEAEAWLHARKVFNLPDFIVNCGGLIGCFIEWAYRERLLQDTASIAEIDRKARDFIARTVDTTVRWLLASSDDPRRSAESLASGLVRKNLARWQREIGKDGFARVPGYIETTLSWN